MARIARWVAVVLAGFVALVLISLLGVAGEDRLLLVLQRVCTHAPG